MEVVPTTVVSDQPETFQSMYTRRSYLERFIPNWRQKYQNRIYAVVSLVAGILLFQKYPIITFLAISAAAYFYARWRFHEWMLTRPRTLYGSDLR